MRIRVLVPAFLALFSIGTVSEATELTAALDRLAKAAGQEESLSPEFKQALSELITALREQTPVARGAPAISSGPTAGSFWDRVQAFGDMRVRLETDRDRPGQDDRYRARSRFRLGANIDLYDGLVAGFRVRTGNPEDANSPHQTWDSMFDSWEINLDRAYLRYQPPWLEGSWVVGGKFGNPFETNPVYGELVWDADVNPEGVSVGYRRALGDHFGLGFTAGEYIMVERNDATDSTLTTIQGSGSAQWNDDWSSRLAVGWYRYGNVNVDARALRGNAGNLVIDSNGDGTPDRFASKFSIWNPVLSTTYTGWRFPVTASAEYFVNSRAVTGDDEGYAFGARVGRVKKQGDWDLFYQFQRVEQESVFSAFAQDDFLLATNFRGHVGGVDYGLTDRLSLRAWALVARTLKRPVGEDDDDQLRIRLDLNAKF